MAGKKAVIAVNGLQGHPCWAAVKDGKLVLEHPEGGPYPVIIPGKGVRVIVNGTERKDKTVVTGQDSVILIPQNERLDGDWQLVISPDRMAATVRIKPTVIIERCLKDTPPAPVVHLEPREEKKYLAPLSLQELCAEITRQQTHGIDLEACRQAANCKEEREIVIARGTSSEAGQDGWIELLFEEGEKIPVKISEQEEVIDLRERFIFNEVMPGTVLARKHRPRPGKPGTNIMGEMVLPPPPREVELVAGTGTTAIKDGAEVVALAAGRPKAIISREKITVSIVKCLSLHQDVDIKLSNVHFAGDVYIQGNVTEGMEVEAGENISITGMVSEATIRAGSSINIEGNVLSSRIIAGGEMETLKGLLPPLEIVKTRLGELAGSVRQLVQYNDNIPLLVNLLLDQKFERIPAAITALTVYIDKNAIHDDQLEEFVKLLRDKLLIRRTKIRDLVELESMVERAETLIKRLQGLAAGSNSNVKLPYALNSRIEAAGRVEVMGIGCDNTVIKAGS